jgi:hypothetical protein
MGASGMRCQRYAKLTQSFVEDPRKPDASALELLFHNGPFLVFVCVLPPLVPVCGQISVSSLGERVGVVCPFNGCGIEMA